MRAENLSLHTSDSLILSSHSDLPALFPVSKHTRYSWEILCKMADPKPLCTPAELMLKVILAGTLSHYEVRGMIDDKRLEHMLAAGKQILYKTHQESDVR